MVKALVIKHHADAIARPEKKSKEGKDREKPISE
jgi:hypothetical protein